MFLLQDGSCSDGGSGTPLSDRTSLTGLDLHSQDSPDQNLDQDQDLDSQEQGWVIQLYKTCKAVK